jgi:acetyl esterase/lipase
MLFMDEDLIHAALALPPERLSRPTFERGDWAGLRAFSERSLADLEATLSEQPEVRREDHFVASFDGKEILCRWYTPATPARANAMPAVVYLHGGGMISGTVRLYDRTVAAYVADAGVPILAVDYRRAPEHPHPAPVEDCLAGVAWLRDKAGERRIDPDRIAIMGDSGGGGLAAATALLARDRGLPLVKQILVYPMLDDRNTTPDPELVPYAGWSYDDNYTGWQALLGDSIGTERVPGIAAPSRVKDLSGVAGAYLEVGELDIFRNECIEYAQRLSIAGVSAELHVHPGCPHGFDRIGSDVAVVQRARQDRIRVIRSLLPREA